MRKALQKPRMKKNASEEQSDAFFSSKPKLPMKIRS